MLNVNWKQIIIRLNINFYPLFKCQKQNKNVENKLSSTAKELSYSLLSRINKYPLIKKAYSEIFELSDPNSINIKSFIYGEYAIPYLNLPKPER